MSNLIVEETQMYGLLHFANVPKEIETFHHIRIQIAQNVGNVV